MTFLDNLSPEDLILLTNAIALSLSKDKTVLEINTLGNFVVGIGCLMLTIASQQDYLESKQQNNQSPSDTIIG